MAEITLITGGARSGKSSLALALARGTEGPLAFIATAVACDEEMTERIEKHRLERGDRFQTLEEPLRLPEAIERASANCRVAVVDCLTVWLGNLFHRFWPETERIRTEADSLVEQLARPPLSLILVSNEVGWGIVPDNPLARAFRDLAGSLNCRIAAGAHNVHLVCAGIPLTLKGRSFHE